MKTLKAREGRPSLAITIGDQDPDRANALASAFADAPAVEVVLGNLLDCGCEAIVSPGNSFGDMGGGIDKAIDDSFGGEAQRRVQLAIAKEHLGELPVGSALIVEMPEKGRFKSIVVAPTMRVPGNVGGTINAYLSMRAALVAVTRSAPAIRSLAVPGLGTGVGGIPIDQAARQMRVAYSSVVEERWRDVVHASLAPFAMHGLKS